MSRAQGLIDYLPSGDYDAALDEIDRLRAENAELRANALLDDDAICRALDENGELVDMLDGSMAVTFKAERDALRAALVKWKRAASQDIEPNRTMHDFDLEALVPPDEWQIPQ
jgi:hypothetical protein